MPHSSINHAFGSALREARKQARLSQEELGFEAELDRTYISLLERGVKSPTLITLMRLCSALNLSLVAFMARVEAERNHANEEGTSLAAL